MSLRQFGVCGQVIDGLKTARMLSPGLWGDTHPVGRSDPWTELEEFKRSLRGADPACPGLPFAAQATCPSCRQVMPTTFELLRRQLVATFDCARCGLARQVHHDAVWTCQAGDYPANARRTYCGSPVRPVVRRLPRVTRSLCPECCKIVLGRVFVEDGAVFMEKTCPDHGYFRDCINSDALLYSKASWWTYEELPGLEFPQVKEGRHCPSDCGLCNQHLSSPCLAQIDLTNRCNLRCPICFANAGAAGYLYEPDYEEVLRQLRVLRELRPVPCTAIQFTGGEPTIHPDFLRIISAARDMGFSHVQIATNGLRMADRTFAEQCAAAGLHTLYLQFDGVGEEAYRATRNHPGIWASKLAVVENCRATGMKICLVPTILKGVNDDQAGGIFRFAVANIDVVSGISYQPVSFTGRISAEERAGRRYTLGDLAHDIAQASGASALRDMFPLSIVVPLSQMLQALTGNPKVSPSCHPDCAFGTYFLVSPEGTAHPFSQVINVEGMFVEMNRIASDIRRRGRGSRLDKWRVARMFKRHFNAAAAPPGLTVKRFVRSLLGLVDKNLGRGEAEKANYKTLLCAGMHFQDRYNFDYQRAQRCVILYSTPAGMFPFCTYNCGPEYRPFVERAYALSGAYVSQAAGGGGTRCIKAAAAAEQAL